MNRDDQGQMQDDQAQEDMNEILESQHSEDTY